MTTSPKPDFTFANHGSITLLKPVSDNAASWCEEHMPDDAQRFAGAYAIEPRYADPILSDLDAEGFTIEA